ncbi:hypothetical protein PROVRETT_07430 [Providencia rettgeri DSM 1131]|nr:hypothetical protein PROVRETT_07430 [Providencia rettgeri DSM 1131]
MHFCHFANFFADFCQFNRYFLLVLSRSHHNQRWKEKLMFFW